MEYKFKVGDEVEIISLNHTIDNYGGDSVVSPIGTVSVITWIEDNEVELSEDNYSYHVKDLKLIKKGNVIKDIDVCNKGIKDDNSISSDGGSSDYYFTKLPKHLIDEIVKTGGIEIKDIARYVYDNDADAFNIIKAEKRIIENRKGVGKKGVTSLYDANKIVFFAKEQYEAMRKDDVDCKYKKEDNK